MDNYQEYKNAMETRLKFLQDQVEALEKDKQRKTRTISADSSDRAQETQNDSVIDSLEEHDLKEMTDIKNALNRIEHGTYGKCVSCGDVISSARLKALPYAYECKDCLE